MVPKPVVSCPADWRTDGLSAALLGLIAFLVFCPVLGHRFLESWDDSTAILLNRDYNPPHLRHLVHYWTQPPESDLFYVPITYSLWGLLALVSRGSAPAGLPFNPAFFYAANLLSHVMSSILVYLILRRLVPSRPAAWIAAAFFALHPIQVEAIANAWTVYTPLSAMFGFFAVWQYLIFSERKVHRNRASVPGWRRSPRIHYAAGTFGFALALLTKPTIVTIPLMVAAIELGLRGRKVRDVALPLGIWLAMAFVIFLVNHHATAVAYIFVPEPLFRTMVPLDAIAFYLGKILVPVHLVMDYGRTPYSIAGHSHLQFTCILAIALLGASWMLRRRWPWILTGLGVFVFGLIPTIGILPFTFQYFSTVADRYVYVAMLGPALVLAFWLTKFSMNLVLPAALAILAILAGMSVAQLRHWQDDWQVAAYTLKVNPRSNAAPAIFEYLFTRKFHRDPPEHPLPAPGLCSLGQSELLEIGDLMFGRHYYEVASRCYQEALHKGPAKADVYARLGRTLERDCRPLEAKEACKQALAIDPNEIDAKLTLGKIAKEIP